MAAKPSKNQESKGRGGPRPNSGRKPRAVTEIKRQLLEAMAGDADLAAEYKNDAAVYAFCLFNMVMRDGEVGITTRLDCATEILNRVWGKPTERRETENKTTLVLDDDSKAALDRGYREPGDPPNPDPGDGTGDDPQPPADPS